MKEFNVDQDLQYKSFEKLLNFESKEKGLYIYGKQGVGKSTFLLNFAKNIKNQKISIDNFLIDKYKVMYLNVNNWIKDIQKSWKSEYDDPIKINTSANVLLIDDLGSEFFHNSTIPYILDLFESRYEFIKKNQKEAITIITSNYSVEDLKGKYSKNLSDQVALERLFSMKELLKWILNL